MNLSHLFQMPFAQLVIDGVVVLDSRKDNFTVQKMNEVIEKFVKEKTDE